MVWVPVLAADDHDSANAQRHLLAHPSVVQFYDDEGRVARDFKSLVVDATPHLAARPLFGTGITWDAFFLFGPDATWEERPGPLAAAGGPVVADTEAFERGLAVLAGDDSPASPRSLTHLFDLELEYRPGMAPVSADAVAVGHLLGSGEGTARGPALEGKVRWDLAEDRADTLCRSHLRGVIETAQGEVRFDSMGLFKRTDRDEPDRWVTSAGVEFTTDVAELAWLGEVLGVWVGEFDMGTYRHRYRVYARAEAD